MERRLTAILVADMVGYSRLMEQDESGTILRQKAHRSALIDPSLTAHKGRVVKTTGDGLLAEFPSVVEAVSCAVEIQREMALREVDHAPETRIEYRIGIHLGDVFHEDGDIHGDGVNIAARLEALAHPGGICLSGDAYNQLRGVTDVGFEDLNEVQVKNIARPIRAWRILLDPAQDGIKAKTPMTRQRKWSLAALVLVISIGLLLGGYWWSRDPSDFKPVDPANMALELPSNPSIAVLPFTMTGDANGRDWIADAISESIISTLSLSPDMVVLSRSTTFAYKGQKPDPAQIASDLGVRYILSGSVVSLGEKLRVTAELADAIKGEQIWSLQRVSTLDDLFDLQDTISRQIFEEMSVSLTLGEDTRTWLELAGGFENYVQVINGRAEFQKFSPEGHANAGRIYANLLRNNPDQPIANYLMGWLYWQKVIIGLSQDRSADLATAQRFVDKALATQEFSEAYTLAAVLALENKLHAKAIVFADKALALSPGSAEANAIGGWVKAASDQPREGLHHMELGMRLEPDYPEWLPAAVNFARLELGLYKDAARLAREVLASDTQDVRAKPYAASMLVAVAVFQGDLEEAKSRAKDFLERVPHASAAYARKLRWQYKNQDFVDQYANALVQAGIPEN
ncbi:adenylate/guanylate cyclase domain-containing protein [Shimia sp. W99]